MTLNNVPDLLLTKSMDFGRHPSCQACALEHVVPCPPSSGQHVCGKAATLRSFQSFGPSMPQQWN